MIMTMCSSCNGTGITEYSIMTCIICNGMGSLSDVKEPRNGVIYEGKEEDFGFTDEELECYQEFQRRHICPDQKGASGLNMVFMLSKRPGNGDSKFVTCTHCGCMHDITDYGEW